jgi:putative flavoprotein involved in K+ transport
VAHNPEPSTDIEASGAREAFRRWLGRFASAVGAGDIDGIEAALAPDADWRDLLALTWSLGTYRGRPSIRAMLEEHLVEAHVSEFAIVDEFGPRRVSGPNGATIEGFFRFETPSSWCRGVAVLAEVDGEWKANAVMTGMEDIRGRERALGHRRPMGPRHGSTNGDAQNWKNRRKAQAGYWDREPDVVVVGAGQGGLTITANLKLMGVDTLLLEKSERVGDGWRKRYDTLVLHDPVWADHLPYLPYPDSWPVYTPKDKIADWFEFYADAMELNVWTQADLYDSKYDADDARWTLKIRTPDGKRVVRPKDVVLATGAAAEVNLPEVPGRQAFRGVSYHSSAHTSAQDWAGKTAVVVGAGNSAHDIAQDLYTSGADVTLVQRSSTYVMSQQHGIPAIFGANFVEGGPPTEYADLLASATSWPKVLEYAVEGTMRTAEKDADLLASLDAVGFKRNDGPDGTGLMGYALARGGGYYIDVGCSSLIADGKIHLVQGAGLEEFTEAGVRLEDGRELPADLVVLATGYKNMRETARRLFGDEVADRCPPVLGIGPDGEISGLYRPLDAPAFWFMAGPLAWVRIYSKHLALQILARQMGVVPR